jgi:hypothetical protein
LHATRSMKLVQRLNFREIRLRNTGSQKVRTFENDGNKSKFHSQRNKEQSVFGKCLLPFSSSGSGWGQLTGCSEHGNKPSGSIKGGESVDKLSDCWLLKKDSAPCS